MRYRPDVDGLRAVAVIPVMLFHAGLAAFGGGFVGVDVFFVISGYLITKTILGDLEAGAFSIITFYERRARRILPALFLVMGVACLFAYLWLLPDELENFGQSVVATTFFSNNILLTLTSGYWALASEFKPLLHTWSLAVEEQYYLFFPLLVVLGWRRFPRRLPLVLAAIGLGSLVVAQWAVGRWPDSTFYLLHTRLWEILLGSLIAFHRGDQVERLSLRSKGALSLAGLAMILASVAAFDRATPWPSLYALLPTVGTGLVILFSHPGTPTYWLLASKPLVGVGLVSYSAYLWHHPLYAFARIHAKLPPSTAVMLALCTAALLLAYLSWRFVEKPFRSKSRFDQRAIFRLSAAGAAALSVVGLSLHFSHGAPGRLFASGAGAWDGMYIGFNERAFSYKKDQFSSADRLRVLVLGNSFGRDAVNMILECLDPSRLEIVYRDDFYDCVGSGDSPVKARLLQEAGVIVFASGSATPSCVAGDVAWGQAAGKSVYYLGTKHFGFNMNWLARLDEAQRRSQFNPLMEETLRKEERLSRAIPPEHYVSLLGPIVQGGQVPVTDGAGMLISPDRVHLTRIGAAFICERALARSELGRRLSPALDR